MTAALQVEKLNRAFGALPVTRDVDLTLERGARRALIGPNGAGKTTLVNLITGVLKPHSGRVLLNGEDITASSQAARARRGLARTFQINQLFRGLTVLENLCMAPRSPLSMRTPRILMPSAFNLGASCTTFRAPASVS